MATKVIKKTAIKVMHKFEDIVECLGDIVLDGFISILNIIDESIFMNEPNSTMNLLNTYHDQPTLNLENDNKK